MVAPPRRRARTFDGVRRTLLRFRLFSLAARLLHSFRAEIYRDNFSRVSADFHASAKKSKKPKLKKCAAPKFRGGFSEKKMKSLEISGL
jgi:hypothetical protein